MRSDPRKSDVVPAELAELRSLVRRLPRDLRSQFAPVCRELTEWARRQVHLLATAQEAVSNMQLDIKCLRFDLDATRHERDEVRRQAGGA